MMTNITVITGASYGDEGKGLMTAFFSEKSRREGRRCLNILHNGGGQRGHTVNMADVGGKRHIFHHTGSGSMSGADSFFSEDFIVNPIIFAEEMNEISLPVKIFRHKSCRWSTPFDMMINQIAEDYRGENRCGSCGAGIWETVLRFKTLPSPSLDEFAALPEKSRLDFLGEVREYAKRRLCETGVRSVPEKWRENMESRGLAEHFLRDVDFTVKASAAVGGIPAGYEEIIFEGGQGLLLSENLTEICGSDRHLTPSFTGWENPVKITGEILKSRCVNSLEVCYVTRSYLTRHGAGPFPGECPKEEICPCMNDLTNVPNPYQGTLRYGRIDVDSLNRRIREDFSHYRNFGGIPRITMSAAVTHLNETGGALAALSKNSLPNDIYADRIYTSYSEDINEIKAAYTKKPPAVNK